MKLQTADMKERLLTACPNGRKKESMLVMSKDNWGSLFSSNDLMKPIDKTKAHTEEILLTSCIRVKFVIFLILTNRKAKWKSRNLVLVVTLKPPLSVGFCVFACLHTSLVTCYFLLHAELSTACQCHIAGKWYALCISDVTTPSPLHSKIKIKAAPTLNKTLQEIVSAWH